MKRRPLCLLAFAALFASMAAKVANAGEGILVVPVYAREAVLLDMDGREVTRWTSERYGAGGARLLEGGRLLRLCHMPVPDIFKKLAVNGGGLEILGKDGSTEWRFWNAVTRHISWGDAMMLPNGNVLSLILDWKSKADMIALGRNPASIHESGMLLPGLMEIQPLENNRGRVVWEWHLYNQLTAGAEPSKEKTKGLVSVHEASQQIRGGWLSLSDLAYDPAHDVIAVMAQGLEEVWLVDHSTTSEQAAERKGGQYDRGGSLLARYSVPGTLSQGGDDPHLRGYQLLASEKQKPVQMQTRFVQDGRLHEERISVNSMLVISTEAVHGTSELPPKSGDLPPIPAYLAKARDGTWVASYFTQGAVMRFDQTGKVRWRHNNGLGVREIISRQGESESCCGNGPAAVSEGSAAGRKIAPIFKATVYSFPN